MVRVHEDLGLAPDVHDHEDAEADDQDRGDQRDDLDAKAPPEEVQGYHRGFNVRVGRYSSQRAGWRPRPLWPYLYLQSHVGMDGALDLDGAGLREAHRVGAPGTLDYFKLGALCL